MLRKFALSLRNPLKQNSLILQTLFKPAINASFSGQNLHQNRNPSFEKRSPFAGSRREKNFAPKLEGTHEKPDRVFSIDVIFKKRVSPVKDIFQSPKFLETYDQELLHKQFEELWHCYLGIKKLLLQVQAARKHTQDTKKFTNPNIYLSNDIFVNQDILGDLDIIMNQLYKLYEKYEAEVITKPTEYLRVIKILVLFEKCNQNTLFWNQANRIISKILSDAKNRDLQIEDAKLMTTFFKILSKRVYYLQKARKTSLSALEDVKKLKKEIFNYLASNVEHISLSFWIGLMDQLDYTNDELLPEISVQVERLLKGPLDRAEVVKCWNKTIKKKSRAHFSNFADTIKKYLVEKGKDKEFKTSELMTIFWALSKETNGVLKREEVDIFWNNLYNNIVVQKDRDFTLFTISSIFSNIFVSEFIDEERYGLLQEWSLIALENSQIQTEGEASANQQEEDESEVISPSQTKNIFHSSCTLILNLLGQGKELTGINIQLIKELLSNLRKNIDDLNPGNYSLLLYSCGKIVSKYREKSRRLDKISLDELTKSSVEFVSIIGEKFLEKIHLAPGPDIAKVFHAYGVLGCLDQRTYELFESTIMKSLPRIPSFFCKHILQGISFIKQNPATKEINTEGLEKALVSKIITSLENADKEEMFNTIQSTQWLLPLQETLAALGPKLEEKFVLYMEEMPFLQISFTLSTLRNYMTLKPETFEKAANLLSPHFATAKLKNLYYTLKTYVNANCGSAAFFSGIEKEVSKRIKNATLENPKINKSDLYLYVLFFNDFVKFNVQDQELIKIFEKLFEDNINDMRMDDIVLVINGMCTYLSKNHTLLKDLLNLLNDMLKIQENIDFFRSGEPTLTGQVFQHGIFSVDLEYKNVIDLPKYKHVYELHNELAINISALRFRQVTTSIFQRNVADILKSMKYEFVEEHPIGIYVVDIFMEPDVILEVNGNNHYILGTKVMVWRKAKKIRQLRKMGYRVEIIPEYEWDIEISELKQPYLQKKIGFIKKN